MARKVNFGKFDERDYILVRTHIEKLRELAESGNTEREDEKVRMLRQFDILKIRGKNLNVRLNVTISRRVNQLYSSAKTYSDKYKDRFRDDCRVETQGELEFGGAIRCGGIDLGNEVDSRDVYSKKR